MSDNVEAIQKQLNNVAGQLQQTNLKLQGTTCQVNAQKQLIDELVQSSVNSRTNVVYLQTEVQRLNNENTAYKNELEATKKKLVEVEKELEASKPKLEEQDAA